MEDKVKKILLRLAEVTLSDLRGSTVHPAESFDPVEIYHLVYGQEKFDQILKIGVDEFERRLTIEEKDIDDAYEFSIDSESMKIQKGGDVDFSDIFTLLLELRYERNYEGREEILKFAELVKGEY